MSGQDLRANPYVGLRPFFENDSLFFFGREQQTAELLDILRANRFLGVVGSSGSGKSSLVRAGLLPGLLGGFLVQDRDRWRTVQMKPGDAPIGNLAVGLFEATDEPTTREAVATLEQAIREGHTGAVVEFLTTRLESNANLFLLVDQFEEIFAFRGIQDDDSEKSMDLARRKDRARRKAEAADFVDLLLALAEQRDLPIYVALTMRTDFLGDCDLFHGLPEALNRGRYLVPRMTREQSRDAVECPVLLLGAQVAPRLLDHLLNELGDRFDRLPVLQHALLRTWDEWQHAGSVGPVDLRHYELAGGLEGALDQDAERALKGLDHGVTARVFKRLTATDLSQRRVRSPARISELMAAADVDRGTVEAIVRRFEEDGRSFVHQSPDGKPDDPRVDISHESLIRQWVRLRDWVDEERRSRDEYVELVKKARKRERGAAALLQDPELQMALDWKEKARPFPGWAQRYSASVGDFESAMRYLDESVADKKKQLQQREEQLQKIAEQQAARAKLQRRAAWGLSAFAIMVLGFAVWIVMQTREVSVQTSFVLALAAESAADAKLFDQGLRLGVLATRSSWLHPAHAVAAPSLSRAADGSLLRTLLKHSTPVHSASFSPDGKRVVTASRDKTARVWDAASGKPVGEAMTHGEVVASASFSPDGKRVVTASYDNTARVWDAASGKPVGEAMTHGAFVHSASFSPDGKRGVTASYDNTARVWDAASSKPVGEAMTHGEAVRSASFSPDGKRVVTASYDNTARVWDAFWPAVSHTGDLIGEVCQRKLRGEARRITEADVRAGRILSDRRIGENVCDRVATAGAP